MLPLLGISHLDRLFDYSVPETMDADAQPGTRVRIRFSGRLVDAMLIERRRHSDHDGSLSPLHRLVSPIQVMPPDMWELVNHLADRSAGLRSDIIRSAIPPRHAASEKAGLFGGGKDWEDLYGSLVPLDELKTAALKAAREAVAAYAHGDRFLQAALDGRAAQAHWATLPGTDEANSLAAVASSIAWNGGGVLLLAPHQRAVDRLTTALRQWMGSSQILRLTSAETAGTRYRRFMSIVLGQGRVVVGTRSAALAPVRNLQFIGVLGESDDNLVDPRAPYLHSRGIAKARADQSGAALAFVGPHRSAEIQQWVEQGMVFPLEAPRATVSAAMPWIRALGETDLDREREALAPGARIPDVAFRAIRHSLDNERPALVQVPRRGYAPALTCGNCRTPVRCRRCNGPMELPPDGKGSGPGAAPTCRWCGFTEQLFSCQECGSHRLRMSIVGHDRTAEELGKAFPGVRIVPSAGDNVVASVPHAPLIVVATTGAEPTVEHSQGSGLYGAAVLLDPWIALGREDLRAQETALRQWMDAAARVYPRDEGGTVVVAADSSLTTVQQLVRWDPAGAARKELDSRREAHLPPAAVVAAVDGTSGSIAELLQQWERPEGSELLGPVPLPPGIRLPHRLDRTQAAEARRLIIRVPHHEGMALGRSLKTAISTRAIHKHTAPLRVVLDPVRIG